ncbi:MAG: EamA family transporter [Dehalococcoidia bacterium]|nr:EamA family transporter [Dehalococcoidia bacterium]
MSRTVEMLLWSLPAIMGWGLYGIFAKLGTARIGLQAILWYQLAMLVAVLVFLTVMNNFIPLNLDSRGVIFGIATGLSNFVAVVALFTMLQRGFPVNIVYPLTALYPLVTVVIGVIFLGEAMTALKGVGVVLAVIAIALLST